MMTRIIILCRYLIRRHRSLLLLFPSLGLTTGPCFAASITDHLVPADKAIVRQYKEVLERKLFVTPGDYGRILFILGGKDGEYAVAIYSDSRSETGVFVTYTKADRNLGDATWEFSPNRIGEGRVKVKRIDAPVAQSVAAAISQAMREMLSRTRKREINPNAERPILGGIDIEFSIKSQAGQTIEGVLTSEMRGKHVVALGRLAQLMVDYCQGSPRERGGFSKRLENEAKQLIVDLQGAQRK